MVRGSLHRFQEPRGEEASGGPAGGHAGRRQAVGQEADRLPGRHLPGGTRRLGARHHG